MWICRQDTKELKLRPGTDVHDYDVRVRSAQKFISKVCLTSAWTSASHHWVELCDCQLLRVDIMKLLQSACFLSAAAKDPRQIFLRQSCSGALQYCLLSVV